MLNFFAEKTFKKKQNELLHNTLDFMATELVDVEDSFHQGDQCNAHAQMQSSQRNCEAYPAGENSSFINIYLSFLNCG